LKCNKNALIYRAFIFYTYPVCVLYFGPHIHTSYVESKVQELDGLADTSARNRTSASARVRTRIQHDTGRLGRIPRGHTIFKNDLLTRLRSVENRVPQVNNNYSLVSQDTDPVQSQKAQSSVGEVTTQGTVMESMRMGVSALRHEPSGGC
jgi:archaellum component FlaC